MGSLHLLSPKGFKAGGVAAGIKASGKTDVGMLVCDTLATAAAVFTTNKVVAAPVTVGRMHVAAGKLRAVVVNAGNANACTGKPGYQDALRMCELTGNAVGCEAGLILPSSTGIIGHMLPMKKIESGIAAVATELGNSQDHSLAFMDAILTTDLKRKAAAATVRIGRQTVTIAGVCKGSGMIGPRMTVTGKHATMLAYLTTDVQLPTSVKKNSAMLQAATDESFNAVTVDDHTSTNDTAVLLASGASGAALGTAGDVRKFQTALTEVCQSLAYQIAADGEGATKVVVVKVTGARTIDGARTIARAIANSPLVKCAMNGNDPNWGRIVSAAGYCGAAFDPDKCVLKLQGTRVFASGQPVKFDAAALSRNLAGQRVDVELACHLGKAQATVWTCDLSKEYVTINADYHT